MLNNNSAKHRNRKKSKTINAKNDYSQRVKRSKTARFLDKYNDRIFYILLIATACCLLLLFILYFCVKPNSKLEIIDVVGSNQTEFKSSENLKFKYYTSEIDGDKFQGEYVSPWYKVENDFEIYVNGWINLSPNNGLDLYLEIEENGNFGTLSYSDLCPELSWRPWKAIGLSGSNVRIIAKDFSSNPCGWLAVSEPVYTNAAIPVMRTLVIVILFLILFACVLRIVFKKTVVLSYFLLATAILCFFMVNYMLQSGKEEYLMRSDGLSYYAYLPAAIVDHDLTFETYNKNFADGSVSSHMRAGLTSTNGLGNGSINKYPVGPSILALPFFLISHFLAGILGIRQDGWNMLYGVFNVVSACVYLLSGLTLLYKYLKLYFNDKTVSIVMISMLLSTNLIMYATYDSSFSHIYSFFAVSLLIFFTDRFYKHKSGKPIIDALGVGAAVGITTMCRATNIIVIIIFLLYGIEYLKDLIPRIKKYFIYYALAAAVSLIVFIPQMAYFYYCTGHFVFNTYSANNEHFNFLSPHPIQFLFSIRKGLFFWFPLWSCSFITPFIIYKNRRSPWFFALAVYMPMQLYLCSAWWCWWYGGAFGQRTYVDIMPIYAIGLAYVLEWAGSGLSRSGLAQAAKKSALAGNLLLCFVGLCLVRNVIFMSGYFNGIIPLDDNKWANISNAYSYFIPTFAECFYLFFK